MEPENGDFSPQLAQYVLSIAFPKSIQDRSLELSEKAQLGTLSRPEEEELDSYLSANAFLVVLQSKARISLRKHGYDF